MNNLPLYGIGDFAHSGQDVFFYSNDIATHLKEHLFINTPHKHSTYIVLLFTKGNGHHQIDFDTYPIKPGSVFLLNPGQVHCWKISHDAEGFVFLHTKHFYNEIFLTRKIESYPFFYLQKNHPVIYLSPEQLPFISNLFNEINQEFYAGKNLRIAKIELLVDLTYIELTRVYTAKNEDKAKDKNKISGSEKVLQLLKYIDENYKIKKTARDYADMMNMSLRHLTRVVNASLNTSTSELILDRIILEAKRMLIHQNPPVASVADELGYHDVSYFVRLFRKRTGLTPREFQNQAKQGLNIH